MSPYGLVKGGFQRMPRYKCCTEMCGLTENTGLDVDR